MNAVDRVYQGVASATCCESRRGSLMSGATLVLRGADRRCDKATSRKLLRVLAMQRSFGRATASALLVHAGMSLLEANRLLDVQRQRRLNKRRVRIDIAVGDSNVTEQNLVTSDIARHSREKTNGGIERWIPTSPTTNG